MARPWARWRDRLLSSALPPLGGGLRAHALDREAGAAALFDLVGGFCPIAQVLFACVRLRLFDELATGPLTAPQVARRLRLLRPGGRASAGAAAALELRRVAFRRALGAGPAGGRPRRRRRDRRDDRPPRGARRRPRRSGRAAARGGRADAARQFWPYAVDARRERPGRPTWRLQRPDGAFRSRWCPNRCSMRRGSTSTVPARRRRRRGRLRRRAGAAMPSLRRWCSTCRPSPSAPVAVRLWRAGLARTASPCTAATSCAIRRRRRRRRGEPGARPARPRRRRRDAPVARARGPAAKGGRVLVAEPMAARRAAAMGDAYFGFYLLAMRRPAAYRRAHRPLCCATPDSSGRAGCPRGSHCRRVGDGRVPRELTAIRRSA